MAVTSVCCRTFTSNHEGHSSATDPLLCTMVVTGVKCRLYLIPLQLLVSAADHFHHTMMITIVCYTPLTLCHGSYQCLPWEPFTWHHCGYQFSLARWWPLAFAAECLLCTMMVTSVGCKPFTSHPVVCAALHTSYHGSYQCLLQTLYSA
jgi:hypothetical protein